MAIAVDFPRFLITKFNLRLRVGKGAEQSLSNQSPCMSPADYIDPRPRRHRWARTACRSGCSCPWFRAGRAAIPWRWPESRCPCGRPSGT